MKTFNLFLLGYIFICKSVNITEDPDVGLDMIGIVTKRGYPIIEHFVETSDGYILGIFNIPYGINGPPTNKTAKKPVILLQHGLLDSSFTWVNNYKNESLAYILADKGYDVWMGNNRGNTFSKRHIKYKLHSEEFWNFTYDEMGRIDTPDTIEYILNMTGQTKLAYVGHSQGTIQFFLLPTVRPDIIPKIAFYGALAPIAFEYNCRSILLRLLSDLDIPELYELVGRKQFLPGIHILDKVDPILCSIEPPLCNDILGLLCGPTNDLNDTRIQVYVSATPADTSVKNMIHWQQAIEQNKFQMFDYGSPTKNEQIYGPNYPTPPQYNLSMITFPTGLYSGTDDWLADPTDVNKLISLLPQQSIVQQIVVVGFAHLDFVWGMKAPEKVYFPMISQIQKYLGNGVI